VYNTDGSILFRSCLKTNKKYSMGNEKKT